METGGGNTRRTRQISNTGKHISVQDTVICVCLSLLYACLVIHYRPSSVPIIYIINNSFAIRYITLQIWKYYGIFGFVLNERGRIHEHKAISKHSESAHGHCLGDFVFKCATHGIRCSSAGGYQTALHYCGAPFWFGGELPVFVVRPRAPNRDARTVTVWYEFMYRATPNIQYIYIYIFFFIVLLLLLLL